jgi:hypothetical protein
MTQYEKSCATTFMGIDISNPPPRVQKALYHYSTRPLDIQDYIKITDFEINLMFSWFWQIMINGQSGHPGD